MMRTEECQGGKSCKALQKQKEAEKSWKEKQETIQVAEKRKAEVESKKAWEEKKVDLEQEIESS